MSCNAKLEVYFRLVKKIIDRPTQTPLCGFTVAMHWPSKFCFNELVFKWFTCTSLVWYNRRHFVNCFQQWLSLDEFSAWCFIELISFRNVSSGVTFRLCSALCLGSSWDPGGLSLSESRFGSMLYIVKSSCRGQPSGVLGLVAIAFRCLTSFSILTETYGIA